MNNNNNNNINNICNRKIAKENFTILFKVNLVPFKGQNFANLAKSQKLQTVNLAKVLHHTVYADLSKGIPHSLLYICYFQNCIIPERFIAVWEH